MTNEGLPRLDANHFGRNEPNVTHSGIRLDQDIRKSRDRHHIRMRTERSPSQSGGLLGTEQRAPQS